MFFFFESLFHNPRSHITRSTLTSASKSRPHIPSWAELLPPIPGPTHHPHHPFCPCPSLIDAFASSASAYLLALRLPPLFITIIHPFSLATTTASFLVYFELSSSLVLTILFSCSTHRYHPTYSKIHYLIIYNYILS
jgi:hypothetical protein